MQFYMKEELLGKPNLCEIIICKSVAAQQMCTRKSCRSRPKQESDVNIFLFPKSDRLEQESNFIPERFPKWDYFS